MGKALAAAFLVVIAGLGCALFGYDPRLPLVRWHDPGALATSPLPELDIAERRHPFRTGLLSLACRDGALRLVLKSRLAITRDDRAYLFAAPDHRPRLRAALTIETAGEERSAIRQLVLPAEVVDAGIVATVLTAPLSSAQLATLRAGFAPHAAIELHFVVFETDVRLAGSGSAAAIASFASRCAG